MKTKMRLLTTIILSLFCCVAFPIFSRIYRFIMGYGKFVGEAYLLELLFYGIGVLLGIWVLYDGIIKKDDYWK